MHQPDSFRIPFSSPSVLEGLLSLSFTSPFISAWTLVIPLPAANSISHHRKEICLIFKYHGATGKTLTNTANRSQHLIPPHSSPSGSQVSEPFVALLGCRAVSFRGRETHAKGISFVCAWQCLCLIKAFTEAFTLLCCSSPTVMILG